MRVFHTSPPFPRYTPSQDPVPKRFMPRFSLNGSIGLGASTEGVHGLMGMTFGIAKRTGKDGRDRFGVDLGPVASYGPNGRHSLALIEFLGVSYERKMSGRITLGAGARLGAGTVRGT